MIHFYDNKDNVRILCGLANLSARNTITVQYIPSLSAEEIQAKREEFLTKYVYETPEGKVNCLIGQWALSGQLNELAPDRLAEAIKGHTPNHMNLHHIVPLSWGGSNDPENLVLISGRVHSFLHRKIYGLVNKKIKEYKDNLGKEPDKPIYILLPKLPRVIQSIYDIENIFTPSEIKQFLAEEAAHVSYHGLKTKNVSLKEKQLTR